ncbi:hypothetical protein AK812_SmicGene41080 [Symbiodinium microadriaticum]|uniref:Uncharacterized protein n=1 Tax=Symbiodinium microadriaticum TaxID=2951 RepID=A0A1Q9C717_SYMMI|nr:hypothetical protein AK812_SmicGene41080 [Symbiodinium microadriaticum]
MAEASSPLHTPKRRFNAAGWANAQCSCGCMETYESWWLETVEGCLEPNCGAPPSWEEWEGERWYARQDWEKRQRQQVMAARLSSKLPAEVLHIVQAAVC